MKRKGMGKRIAAIVLAITMSISMAGFQTGIVKADITEGEATIDVITGDETIGDVITGDEATEDESTGDTTTDDTTTDDETPVDETNGNETTGDETTGDEATGDETTSDETTGDETTGDETTDDENLDDQGSGEEENSEEEISERDALLATSPEIIAQQTENNVTVYVNAPEGAFPGGTTVEIIPVYQTNELVDVIDSVENTEDLVAFDITFYDIDGNEIQPRDGYTVNVSFELAAESELARDDATLQVFHVDDAQNATPVGGEIPSSSEGVEVSVEAESFSVYALTVVQDPVEVKDEYYITVDQTMTITRSLGRVSTRNIQVEPDANVVNVENAQIIDNAVLGFIDTDDDAVIDLKAISAGDTTVTVNFEYEYWSFKTWSYEWKSDSVSFKVHVADPQEFNLGENLTGKSQEVNVVLGGFTVDENNVENWFRNIFGKSPKEAITVSYDNGEVVNAEVVGIKNGYSIFDAAWAEKAAVVTVKLTPVENAAGKSDTVHLNFNVIDGKIQTQTISFEVTVGATHTVTFDYGYENKADTLSVEHGSMVTKPADITREGYKFLGWYVGEEEYNFDTPVTGDLTLTAKWGKDYNAEFYLLKNVNVIPLENGSTQYPASNYTAKDLTNMVGTITSTAFVNLGDGLDVTGLNIAESFQSVQDVIEETPEDGYLETLKGEILTAQGFVDSFDNYDILWYVVKKAGGTYHVDGVVYDKTANYKTLAYDANTTDSVDVPSSMAYPLGTKVQVAAQPFRTGYTFTGWNTQKDGKGTSYDAGADLILNDNTTLYAQWKKNTKTDVNFYIQLDSTVMDIEGDINRRPVNYFSGSVAKSTMNANVSTSFKYAGEAEKAADADSTIRKDLLGKADYIADCPADSDVFANLQNDVKTLNKFAELNIDVTTLTADNYDIYWYVVKYDTADGWHVDGILHKKTTNPGTNPEPTNPDKEPGTTPGGGSTPGGTNPGGSTTPGGDSGTVVIPDDETPLAPGPDNDADTPSDNEESDSSNDDNDGITEIEDEDTPLSDGTDIEDEDVPLSDGSDLDDAETIIEDEDTPLSDNPLTGDSVSVLWAVLAVMAAMGLLVVFVAGKRKKED